MPVIIRLYPPPPSSHNATVHSWKTEERAGEEGKRGHFDLFDEN